MVSKWLSSEGVLLQGQSYILILPRSDSRVIHPHEWKKPLAFFIKIYIDPLIVALLSTVRSKQKAAVATLTGFEPVLPP